MQAALDVLSASAEAAIAINRLVGSLVTIDRLHAENPASDYFAIIVHRDRKRILAAIAEVLSATSGYTKDVQAVVMDRADLGRMRRT